MKIEKYLFRILYNIEVESLFLYKSNTYVMGLYSKNRLVGCMYEVGSPFSVAKLVEQIEEIFPPHHLNMGKWKRERNHIGMYLDQNSLSIHYFDVNDNEVSKSQGKFFLNKHLWNIEPIPAMLKKSDTLIAGLYLHHLLRGVIILDNKLSFKSLAASLEYIFPNNLNDLDTFIEKNENRIIYYNSNDIVLFDENNNVIHNDK